MADSLLQINNLSVDFTNENGNVHALQDISLEVKRGEIVAIVGESGSGKSVTSLSILQLLPTPPAKYVKGEILFNASAKNPDKNSLPSPDIKNNTARTLDLLRLSPEAMQSIRGNDIAMIFQEPMTSLNPVYTCGDQVMEAIRLHQQVSSAVAKQKTIELFERVKLPNPKTIINRYPHQLSGGQKQRVMIAMAMSCNPSLLIADEPTTALDKAVEASVLQLIKELQQQSGMSVIFITHDLNLVTEIADRVIVMYKGKVVEQGSVQQVYQSPTHPYTKELLGYRNALQHDKALSAATGQPLLKVEDLSVTFPPTKTFTGNQPQPINAVDHVSFEVRKGEMLGLVGGSGSGKTTLSRTLLRLIEPSAGKIFFRGQEITTLSQAKLRNLRRDMQLIFQDPYSSLNPSIPIGEAIMEPLRVHRLHNGERQRREKVIHMLESVHLLPEHFSRYPHEFSGGQRQRIVIARALILNPSFIICDEPVSALDVSVQAQVLQLLNDLKKELGFSAIFISHDPVVVDYMCDRVITIEKGRIVDKNK